MHQNISGCLRIAAFGAGCSGGISAQLDLALQDGVDTLWIDHKKYKVSSLSAELETNVAAFQRNHRGRSPGAGKRPSAAAGHGATAIVPANADGEFLD